MKKLKSLLVGLALVAGMTTFAAPAFAETAGEANAVRQAHSYLQVSAFSKLGLISQLKFSGFSTKSAEYGVAHCGANWNKQAVKKAREYLKISGFSYQGMVAQLEFDKFTPAQAVHGAHGAGLG